MHLFKGLKFPTELNYKRRDKSGALFMMLYLSESKDFNNPLIQKNLLVRERKKIQSFIAGQ